MTVRWIAGVFVLTLAALGADTEFRPYSGCAAEDAPLRRITIVHTNDLHAHLENFAVVTGIAKREMARTPKASLWLDAGDCITGSPVSTLWQGMPVFEVMNRMPISAGVIGNHEFDHGWKRVHEFVATAKHPLLCANATGPDGKPFGDGASRVIEAGGVKFGVIGLLTGALRQVTTKAATEGCEVEAPLEAAKRLVPEMRKQADVVVLLTHVGVDVDGAIAGAVQGIDVIVGGHSHTTLKNALVSPFGTRTVQAGRYGEHVGVIDLAWDPREKKISEFSSRLIRTDDPSLPRDAAVAKLVAEWEAKADPVVAAVIGRADGEIGKKELVDVIGRIYREVLGADVGYQNLHGVRDVIRKGDVRVRDVWKLVPFDNTLVRVSIPGARLPGWAKKELGGSLDPAKTYVVATNSYVGDHLREIFGSDDFEVADSGVSMRDAVVNWVREHGGFDPSGKPLVPAEKTK